MAENDSYSPFANPAPPKPSAPRTEIWRLYKHDQMIACVIPDHTEGDAGWALMLVDDNGELGLSKHFGGSEGQACR